MPRLAPQMNGTPCVMEHRLTLGTYERKQLAEAVDSYRKDKLLENIPNVMLGVAGLAAGAGVIGIGYGTYKVAQGIAAWADSGILDWTIDAAKAWQKVSSGSWWKYKITGLWTAGSWYWPDLPAPETPIDSSVEGFGPWTVVGLTYDEWWEQGGPQNAAFMAAWVDWVQANSN